MIKQLTLSLMAVCSIQLANANEIELNLSDDLIDVRLQSDYEQDFYGRFAYAHANSGDRYDVDTNLFSYTFAARGELEGVDVLLGIRPYLMDVEDAEGVGIALGVGAGMEVIERLRVSGEVFYSPEIITGGDIDDHLDLELKATYQIIENGALSIGYRILEVDAGSDDFDAYDDLFIGMTLQF
jgi:hypothetical protein